MRRIVGWMLIVCGGWACHPKPISLGSVPSSATCIAVLPLEVRYDAESFDEILSEFLALEIAKRNIRVLTPKEISQAFRDADQPLPPSIDAYWAKKLGEQMGVDAIIFGQLSRVPIQTTDVGIVSKSIKGDEYVHTMVPKINISVETYLLRLAGNQISWTYGDRDVIPLENYIDWLSVSAEKMAESLAIPEVASQTNSVCGKLPTAKTAEVKAPVTEAVPVKVAVVLTDQQKKVKRSLENSLRLSHTLFEGRTDIISKEGASMLNDILQVLKSDTAVNIEVIGHVDLTKDTANDLELSKKRAQVVRDFLVKAGVKASRVQYSGEGGTRPIVPNLYEKSRELNRRTEFKRK